MGVLFTWCCTYTPNHPVMFPAIMTYFPYKESFYCGHKRQAWSSLAIDQLKGTRRLLQISSTSTPTHSLITLPSHHGWLSYDYPFRTTCGQISHSKLNLSPFTDWVVEASRSYTLTRLISSLSFVHSVVYIDRQCSLHLSSLTLYPLIIPAICV